MTEKQFLPGVKSLGNEKLEDLLMWKDPKLSGGVLAGFLAAYWVIELSGWSLFCVGCNLAMTAVLGTFLWANLASYLPSSYREIPIPAVLKADITSETVTSMVEAVLPTANAVRAKVYILASGSEPVFSVKVMVALYAALKVVSMFGGILTLGLVTVLAAFALPKVYELKQKEIDDGLAMLSDKVGEVYKVVNDTVIKKIPKSASLKKAE